MAQLFQRSYPSHIVGILATLTVRPNALFQPRIAREPMEREKIMANGTLFGNTIVLKFVMVLHVFGLRGKQQIFYTIVKFITVYMVDYFNWMRKQFATKMLFHHHPMFGYLSAIVPNKSISVANSTATVFVLNEFRLAVAVVKSIVVTAKTLSSVISVVGRLRTVGNRTRCIPLGILFFNTFSHNLIIKEIGE